MPFESVCDRHFLAAATQTCPKSVLTLRRIRLKYRHLALVSGLASALLERECRRRGRVAPVIESLPNRITRDDRRATPLFGSTWPCSTAGAAHGCAPAGMCLGGVPNGHGGDRGRDRRGSSAASNGGRGRGLQASRGR